VVIVNGLVLCLPWVEDESNALATWEFAMVEAIVLVQAKVGQSSAVAQAVGELEGVTEAYVVTGPYDVIVRVEADSLDDLGRMVVSRIQAVEGVTRTLTCSIIGI
jgi:DNA-binding Lrp family transcriptional regulator